MSGIFSYLSLSKLFSCASTPWVEAIVVFSAAVVIASDTANVTITTVVAIIVVATAAPIVEAMGAVRVAVVVASYEAHIAEMRRVGIGDATEVVGAVGVVV